MEGHARTRPVRAFALALVSQQRTGAPVSRKFDGRGALGFLHCDRRELWNMDFIGISTKTDGFNARSS